MNEDQRARQLDMLRHFPTLLARWAGAHARMAEMSRSHRTLRIEFTRPDLPGFLLLACVDPAFIHGPTDWPDAHVSVVLASDDDGFIVQDPAADVRIAAGRVEIKEFHERTRNA